jgi:dodecin
MRYADREGTIACAGHAQESGPRTEQNRTGQGEEELMSDSVYRVTGVIGTSATSWEEAAKNAVETAAKTLRDLRVGEVVKFDVTIEDGKVTNYRARVNISFKYEA